MVTCGGACHTICRHVLHRHVTSVAYWVGLAYGSDTTTYVWFRFSFFARSVAGTTNVRTNQRKRLFGVARLVQALACPAVDFL
jgi:hypothetical protein